MSKFGFGLGFPMYFGGGNSPLSLFAMGEQGVWYDPSDLTTMFQDSAGVTPVTAVEQVVGLIYDKRKGLALGPETWSNAAAQVFGEATIVSPGVFRILSTAGVNSYVANTSVTAVGEWWEATFTIDSVAVAGGGVGVESAYGTQAFTTVGVKRVIIAASNTTLVVKRASSATDITISNVSFKRLPGNHAIQATTAAKPVLSARKNLLTYSEDFTNAVWLNQLGGVGVAPTITANAGTDPLGGSTADRIQFSLGGGTATGDFSRRRQDVGGVIGATVTGSVWLRSFDGVSTYAMQIIDSNGLATAITVTGAWQRFQIAVVTAAATAVVGVGLRGGQVPANPNAADILAWGAQVEYGSAATAYQYITTATAYDTVGFPHYLKFDGVDDGMATAAVDFSATDKASMFAGVTKLSDVAGGVVVDLSSGGLASSFGLLSPPGPSSRFAGSTARGSGVSAFANLPTGSAAPFTGVIYSGADLAAAAGAELSIRLNGGTSYFAPEDAGGGNWGAAYPLYIGRRGGASLPFSGRIYSLIVRGATSSDAEITATESHVATKTGVTL